VWENRSGETERRPRLVTLQMRRLLILIPATLVLAACGGGSDSSEGSDNGGGEVLQTVSVSATEFALNPATVTLPQAGTYEFNVTNDGQITHALEIEEEGGGAEAETDDIGPGESKTLRFTFSADGSYEMYCPIGNHKAMGMEGEVIVAGGGGGSGASDDDSGGTSY
jgi:plastocyanin